MNVGHTIRSVLPTLIGGGFPRSHVFHITYDLILLKLEILEIESGSLSTLPLSHGMIPANFSAKNPIDCTINPKYNFFSLNSVA